MKPKRKSLFRALAHQGKGSVCQHQGHERQQHHQGEPAHSGRAAYLAPQQQTGEPAYSSRGAYMQAPQQHAGEPADNSRGASAAPRKSWHKTHHDYAKEVIESGEVEIDQSLWYGGKREVTSEQLHALAEKLYLEKKAVAEAATARWKRDRDRQIAAGEWAPREKADESQRKDKRSGGKKNNVRIYQDLLLKQGFKVVDTPKGAR